MSFTLAGTLSGGLWVVPTKSVPPGGPWPINTAAKMAVQGTESANCLFWSEKFVQGGLYWNWFSTRFVGNGQMFKYHQPCFTYYLCGCYELERRRAWEGRKCNFMECIRASRPGFQTQLHPFIKDKIRAEYSVILSVKCGIVIEHLSFRTVDLLNNMI